MPIRVLFVDDEENILKSLRRLFRNEDWEQRYAGSGAEALAELDRGWTPDVVVTDQRMPAMTGVALLKEVRRRHPGCVRIVLSGYTEVQAVLDAVNEGAIYKFLTKPWDDEVLRGVVREAADGVAARQELERLQALLERQSETLVASNHSLHHASWTDIDARLLVEALPVGVVAVGEDGDVYLANPEARRLLGDLGRAGGPWRGGEALGSPGLAGRREVPYSSPHGRCTAHVLWRE
ncbi:MAG: response regulator [Deferrisomatales bacterium]